MNWLKTNTGRVFSLSGVDETPGTLSDFGDAQIDVSSITRDLDRLMFKLDNLIAEVRSRPGMGADAFITTKAHRFYLDLVKIYSTVTNAIADVKNLDPEGYVYREWVPWEDRKQSTLISLKKKAEVWDREYTTFWNKNIAPHRKAILEAVANKSKSVTTPGLGFAAASFLTESRRMLSNVRGNYVAIQKVMTLSWLTQLLVNVNKASDALIEGIKDLAQTAYGAAKVGLGLTAFAVRNIKWGLVGFAAWHVWKALESRKLISKG